MELHLLSIVVLVTLITLLIITLYYPKTILKRTKKQILPPKVSGGWPLLGHLNVLSGPELPHIALSNLADKYGPIFTLRLGTRRAVVVSNYDVARECFTNRNDIVFSNRPKTEAIEYMGYNFAMFGFKEPGPYWRELRKITMATLLSSQSVAKLTDAREIEVDAMMKMLYRTCGDEEYKKVAVEMKKVFEDLTLNFVTRIVFGDVEDARKETLHDPIKEFFKDLRVLTLSDVVPFMKWFGYFGPMKKVFKNTSKKMDIVLQSMIEQHKKHGKDQRRSFMGNMMDVSDRVSREFPEYDADTITKATCQTVILGGTETTVVLTWALCLLLNNRHTLKRAQQELDTHIGRGRLVKEPDMVNLVYIRAIVKETLRTYPPAPLLSPRLSSEDTTLAGYYVPSGTQLIINGYKLQNDPNLWADPLQFKPERFLDDGCNKDVDVRGRDFELIPFGAGRRICPGISFVMQMMELSLASFLHGFEIDTVVSDEHVDMTGSFGATNVKAKPLNVVLKPRLSPEAYY